MNGFEVYCQYLALKMHFAPSGNYDYFKYAGKVKANSESFLKRRDKSFFSRIAKKRDPFKLLVANFMFNEKNKNLWIGDVHDEHLATFEKFESSGEYIFKGDLYKLKESFRANFSLENGQTMPYILRLLHEGEVSFFTACVFESLLNLNARWEGHDSYMIFEDESKRIAKSVAFFKIDNERYQEIALERYS